MILGRLKKFLSKSKYNFARIGNGTSIGDGFRVLNEKYISIGEDCALGKDCFIGCWDGYANVKLKPNLDIGDRFYARERMTILCAGNICIGNAVTLAGGVLITNENHGTNPLTENYLDNPLDTTDIEIDDGVWIGENCVILPGVKIGKKAIIGAGSIVTKDIPAYTIACGNPCRVVKKWNDGNWENI